MAHRIIVYHAYYGCDTGCCGHRVELDNDSEFAFDHCDDDEDPLEFAKKLIEEKYGREHVADLDWLNSQIYNCNDIPVVKQ